MTDPDPTDAAEQAALYLAGALPEAEARLLEQRLADGWPEAADALRALEPAARELAAADPVPPPDRLKADLLTRLDDPRALDRLAAAAVPGAVFRFADDADFVPTAAPGVSIRTLHVDPRRRQFTCLLRIAPGAVYPSHPHDGPEECVVLSGDVTVFGVRMTAGDYQRVEPGTEHAEHRSETGALLFLIAPLSLLTH